MKKYPKFIIFIAIGVFIITSGTFYYIVLSNPNINNPFWVTYFVPLIIGLIPTGFVLASLFFIKIILQSTKPIKESGLNKKKYFKYSFKEFIRDLITLAIAITIYYLFLK